ncbi:RNA polymerase sigma factor [Nocardioides insulae]|uniref:RNA polymerase sigma factor n=1 Tax=Nocardioides insulae TaxID=394734 RepID=UPI00041AA56C|nr:sigma-70 family RNA polymerase sigma factor [Nocardioides insulae]
MATADPSADVDASAQGTREVADAPGSVWERATAAFDRWLADDEEGLSELVGVMTPVLWQVVRAYGLSHELAEDVVQSTWLALVRRQSSIIDSAAIGGWLTITARREAWRTAQVQHRADPTQDEDLAVHLPQQRSAESAAVERDGQDRLWAAVNALPERCRRLLRVVAFEHRPDYATLAVDLGMPVGSIGPTRGRCLAKLRVALIEAGDVDE